MKSDPDIGLVQKAKKGNRAAFGELANRYYEMVYVLAYGVVNNREVARDVTQDVFIKVYERLHKFDEKSKFKTWLYRVSVNAAIDQHRKKKPVQSIDVTDAAEESDRAPVVMTDTAPSPRDQAHQEELKARMKEALSKLSEDHRAILILREWQGLSYQEIAESLEIDHGTVMSRLFYARKKLGEVLTAQNMNDNSG